MTGNTDIEDSLDKLDKLTQEEARMASAELLKITHSVDGKVKDVQEDVQDVGNKVQGIDDRLQGIGVDVKDELYQINRSLSFSRLLLVLSPQTASQGTNSEIAFHDGYRPQIHPPIITTHARPITMGQLNGSFKEVYLISGNPLAPFCGSTENVRYSRPSPSVNY